MTSTSQLTERLTESKVLCADLLKRRFIVAPGFEIYGGTAGLFDFGPPGAAIKVKLEQQWRDWFIVEDDLMEVNTTCLTPHACFKASGHVERFTDLMIKDEKTNDKYRADQYLVSWIDAKLNVPTNKAELKIWKEPSAEESLRLKSISAQADSFTAEELDVIFQREQIKSPAGNSLSNCFPFNLMFRVPMGPQGDVRYDSVSAYLRPETAQGMFVNFRRCYEQNLFRLPLGVAQIGLGFRNEIAPRNGLLRVREFQMAEVEFFYDPLEPEFEKFEVVRNLKVPLFTKERQLRIEDPLTDLTLGEAVDLGIISNKPLGYFIGRTFGFLKQIGLNPNGLRFRQHLDTEMAHYASDCWDAEVLSSCGWIECAGLADRSAYDLNQHMAATGVPLTAQVELDVPLKKVELFIQWDKKSVGLHFKGKAKAVMDFVTAMDDDERRAFAALVDKEGKANLPDGSEVTKEMITSTNEVERVTNHRTFVPSVIEPSFGIGRLFSMVMEHSFTQRSKDDPSRNYLRLPFELAPINCSILPLNNRTEFKTFVSHIRKAMKAFRLTTKVDDSSASIGKRYARTDEIGVPLAVTVDFQSLQDGTVTLRDRDSMEQIRATVDEIIQVVNSLTVGTRTWKEIKMQFTPINKEE